MEYKQAYDKIIDAYFKDEIKPMNCNFCFCGTLAQDWERRAQDMKQKLGYSYSEFGEMEEAFFSYFPEAHRVSIGICDGEVNEDTPDYEERLFKGMCAALEVIKEIHRNRGENVDEEIVFRKRELLPKDRAVSGQEVK